MLSNFALYKEKNTLQQMLDFYKRKYTQYNVFHVIKSLTFFEDAEKNPSFPKMKKPLS